MPLFLFPLPAERFESWRARSRDEYEADLIRAGDTAVHAQGKATDVLDGAFPEGAPTVDNAVFDLVSADGEIVGYLWLGRDASGDGDTWWIWDILVEPFHRGQGYARAALARAEEHVRSRGGRSLGLSVFGFNDAARGLYASAGYEVTTVKMRKRL